MTQEDRQAEDKPEDQMWRHECGWVNYGHQGLCTGCVVRFAFLDSFEAIRQLLQDGNTKEKK